VSSLRRRVLRMVGAFTSPLDLEDYVGLVNPLWSARELRGRVERLRPETGDAVSVLIRPGADWPGHEPGQYLRIGLEIDGIHHWRAYSLTSDPQRPDNCIAITPKLVPEGKVSPYLVQRLKPGTIVKLGGVEGTFTLPDPLPEKLLFLSAGSGVTPIMSMLRALDRRDELRDVVHVHSARNPGDVIFGDFLRRLAERHDGFRLHEQHTGEAGRLEPSDLDGLCPDWREREAYLSGPKEMLEETERHFEAEGVGEQLRLEHFQPSEVMGEGEHGEGGTVKFRRSGVEGQSDGSQPILVAGEEAGATLPYGCRMGICHTCVGLLAVGRVRDLRSNEIKDEEGQMIRTCINAPEGHVEIDL
jgi:ferredoxin-NADP reductase